MTDSDEAFMSKAIAMAKKAEQQGEVPVGAVLITTDYKVFTAHNAPIQQHDPTAHAEIQVIRQAASSCGNYRLTGARLYVTMEPCLMCAGAILHSRIEKLVYGTSDPKFGAVSSVYHTLEDNRLNHQVDVISGVLTEQCRELIQSFFRSRRKKASTLIT